MQSVTILITGATSGIGKAVALDLAKRGYTVFATGRRMEALEQMRTGQHADRLIPVLLDVTSTASAEAAARTIHERTGGNGIDVLINNAGYALFGPALDLSDEALRHQFNVNVFGLMNVTRTFARPMLQRRCGRILNISSIGGRIVFPFDGAYHATKFAVEALSDALRVELAPFGIRVILIEPGPIRTGFTDAAERESAAFRASASPFKAHVDTYYKMVEQTYRYAPGPAPVVRTIHRAITARRPQARYVTPWQNRIMLLLFEHVLPTGVKDALLLQALKPAAARPAPAAQPAAAQPE